MSLQPSTEARFTMPNIGAVLKQEIARLSRKEVRGQVTTTKKASAQHRRDIAALKRQVAALAKQVAMLAKRPRTVEAAGLADDGQRSRFSAKGLKSHRAKLGLSAGDYGKLVGVSAQSVYNWEAGKASPRAGQRAQLAALRSLGKREAHARLGASRPAPAKKAAKRVGRRKATKVRKGRKTRKGK
jgi:DNA-binding transcriptional regulator YiaG